MKICFEAESIDDKVGDALGCANQYVTTKAILLWWSCNDLIDMRTKSELLV